MSKKNSSADKMVKKLVEQGPGALLDLKYPSGIGLEYANGSIEGVNYYIMKVYAKRDGKWCSKDFRVKHNAEGNSFTNVATLAVTVGKALMEEGMVLREVMLGRAMMDPSESGKDSTGEVTLHNFDVSKGKASDYPVVTPRVMRLVDETGKDLVM